MKDYEKEYNEFWKDIIEDEKGDIDKEKLMKELSDFSRLIANAGKVYCHVTNGNISNVLTDADVVIAVADDCCAV